MALASDYSLTPWAPPSPLPAWRWVEENVELGHDSDIKGRVSFDWVPMSRFVLDKFQDPKVRRITMLVSAQSAKTKTAEFALKWKVKNDPGETIWYTDTNLSAKDFYKTRLLPGLEDCEVIRPHLPTKRERRTNTLVQFDAMNLYVLGAETRRNRERITAQTVLCDEVRNYPKGAMTSIRNRYKTVRNFKEVIFSTAGEALYDDEGNIVGDELFLTYWNGTRHMWFWPCPHCGHWQTFRFGRDATPLYPEPRECGGFVWDDNDLTHPKEGVWNFQEVGKTVRYECENPECRYRFRNSEKLQLIQQLEDRQTNPMADPSDVSTSWWEAYMPWAQCEWPKIVEKFLRANVMLSRGDSDPLKIVIQESIGEPWVELRGEAPQEHQLRRLCGGYPMGQPWPAGPEVVPIITVDVQEGYLVTVLRQWRAGSLESRLVQAKKVLDFDELRALQMDYNVKDRCVWIDCAHKPKDVFEACLKYGRWVRGNPEPIWDGWSPLLGDSAKEFTQQAGKDSIKTFWKRVTVDPGIGTARQGRNALPRYSWCNDHYREMLYSYRLLGKGPSWQLPDDIHHDYLKQLTATERRMNDKTKEMEWHERGRHDYGDCELMQLVVVDIGRLADIPARR